MTVASELAGLYDELARWQWRRRDRAGMALRKRLLKGEARPRSADDVDDWLFEFSGAPAEARMLDVGCGFGLTLVRWAAGREGVTGHGLTIAPWQVERAREHVRSAGLDDRVRIALGTFERPPPGPFDVVLSIESLCHAPDLSATLTALGEVTDPAGYLVVLEDMASDSSVQEMKDGLALRRLWATPHLWALGQWRASLDAAGWCVERECDLTERVPAASSSRGATLRKIALSAARRVVGRRRRQVCDAFLGGIALERLYAAGAMRYVALVCRRTDRADPPTRSSSS